MTTTLKNQVIEMRKELISAEEIKVLEEIKNTLPTLFKLNVFKNECYIQFKEASYYEMDEQGDLVLTVKSRILSNSFKKTIVKAMQADDYFSDCVIENQSGDFICIAINI